MKDDFVDITPRSGNKKEVRLTPEDLHIIKENPRGLTKEGVMVKVWQWAQSNNMPLLIRYLAMYKMCNKLQKSEVLDDGSIVLGRRTFTN